MKKIIYYSIILLVSSLVFNSCSDDENDFDWKNYKPGFVGSINGPAEVSAHGIADYPYTYEVSYYRGGSVFDWEVTTYSGDGEVVVETETVLKADGKVANIIFPQRSTLDSALITVVETTANGVSGDPETKMVYLNPFCPYDMEPFVGDYVGTAEDTHASMVTMETTENLNELRVSGLAEFVPRDWGENWVEGDGSCLIEFGCGDVVTIRPQWIGDSDYPDVYGIVGDGTVDVENKTITLNYQVFYGWDGAEGADASGPVTTVLTLQ